jgi:hypothetical protein
LAQLKQIEGVWTRQKKRQAKRKLINQKWPSTHGTTEEFFHLKKLKARFYAVFMRLFCLCSKSMNYFGAFNESASACGIQDGHFAGPERLIFA